MRKRSTFVRIFSFMNKGLKAYFISLIMLSLFGVTIQILIAMLFKDMFNAIAINDYKLMVTFVKNDMIIILSCFIIYPIFAFTINRTIAITTGNIRKIVYDKLSKLPLSYFKNHHSGDLVSRMTNDISETEKLYDQVFFQIIFSLVVAIGTLAYMIYLNWIMGLVTIIGAGITLLVNLYYAKILRLLSTGVQEKLAKLNESLTNLLDGVHVIRCFNLQSLIFKKYYHKNKDVYDTSIKRVHTQSTISSLNTLSGFISFGGLMCVGAYLAIKYNMPLGIIIASIQLQNGLRNFTNSLGTYVTGIQTALAAGDRVLEVLDQEEEPLSYDLETTTMTTNSLIEMNQLSFKYDDEFILNNLSLRIPKGKMIAIVGPTGGGKTTLFKIILNFFKPTSGDYFINGKPICEQTIQEIRKLLAYVPQDAYLFTGTIASNILHGKKDASKEEMIQAAKIANCHEFIMELEHGYDTMVGEKGSQLSGGQRQRVAIARAVLKDAPILLLDEATSSLDTESEIQVQEALNHLMVGKTTLVIAHRLQTIQNADEILVLKNGMIVEQGTHADLLAINGVYKNLYEKQFKIASA